MKFLKIFDFGFSFVGESGEDVTANKGTLKSDKEDKSEELEDEEDEDEEDEEDEISMGDIVRLLFCISICRSDVFFNFLSLLLKEEAGIEEEKEEDVEMGDDGNEVEVVAIAVIAEDDAVIKETDEVKPKGLFINSFSEIKDVLFIIIVGLVGGVFLIFDNDKES